MEKKLSFNYFYGTQADQFSFYRIPKALFQNECFRGLSSDAKILYGLMLDRMSLSIKNQWFDDQNRAYIYFSLEDIMELLNCGKNKAVKSLQELDTESGIGLIEKKRQGFAGYGIHTMGDIAMASIHSENLLYKIFGIDAELLIDHAWGCESCRMHDIKNYHSEDHSLSNGQVLMRNYSFEEAEVIVKEMTDILVLDLIEKELVTNSVILWIAYDHKYEKEPSRGSARFPDPTNSSREIINTVKLLYRQIADRYTGIRRIEVCAGKVFPESYRQYDLFSDPEIQDRERRLQKAVLEVKNRYGKNAIMRGSNLLDCSTYIEKNEQIGGHRA